MFKDYIKLSIPKKPEYVGVARLTSSSIASRLDFDIDDIDDIKVAIGEACTSIIQTSSDEEQNYDIEFELKEDRLSIKLTDLNKPVEKEETDEMGLGLIIIQTLMDEVETDFTEDFGKTIKMTKIIKECFWYEQDKRG